MYSQMKELYTKIAEFYAFDMSKKSMEEFFGDIKTFLAEYEVRHLIRAFFFSAYQS